MKTWDAVIIGGGVIGLCCALELSRRELRILLIERGEPGREASHSAAGMLANCDPHTPEVLRPIADASAKLYHEIVHELQDETGMDLDLRREGTIAFLPSGQTPTCGELLSETGIQQLAPSLAGMGEAYLLPEASVDPRRLVQALTKSLHHRTVDICSGTPVVEIEMAARKVIAVRTEKSRYPTPVAVNCAGAWAARIAPIPFRTRPVKGQMLSVIPAPHMHFPLRHVVRHQSCYLVPRSDGRVVIGSTLEEAGYDKHVDPATIQALHQSAAKLLPELAQGRILEAWSGLRPGTPDALPMLGETSYGGYLAATGHYRDGILLAPVTARIIAKLACGETPEFDLLPYSPERFL